MEKTTNAPGSLAKRNSFIKLISFSWMKKSVVVEMISLLFVVLFLYTGISKLMEYIVFKEQIAQSPVLKPVAPVIAWGLPMAEFIVSVLLFLPRYRLKGLYAAFVLMLLFTIYIIAILSFSNKLPCSCGGVLEELSWQEHLVFNGAFICLALTGILLGRRLQTVIRPKETPASNNY